MILCCGEALIDMLPEGAGFVPHPGGGVFNTAVALGRLGAPAALFTGLGRDFLAARLEARLAEAGVDTRLCPRSDRPTTLAFVTLSGGEARYAFYDEGSAGRMLSPGDLPALPASVTALFLGGISLAAEPCGSAFEVLALREAGRRVIVLDPNIRPAVLRDAPACRARLSRLMARSDILRLSREDLDWLAPGQGEAFIAARLAEGVALVIVSAGAQGVTAHSGGRVLTVPARPVPAVVDTVGAGDTFNAGFLAALEARGRLSRAALAALPDSALEAALRQGVAAAALSVTRAGANPPWAHELAAQSS